MKRILFALVSALLVATAVGDQKISGLGAASALTSTDKIPVVQSTGNCPTNGGTCRTTPVGIQTFIDSTAGTWTALQTFGSNISIGGVTAGGATGTGNVVFSTSPTLTTPSLGVAVATSINGTTVPSGSTLATTTGSLTSGHCAQFSGTTGTIADSGAACGGGGGGGTPGGSSGAVQYNNGGAFGGISVTAGQILQGGSTPTGTATPTLGASGTLGSLTMGNATSGTLTVQPVTGALGTVTASLPANTGTLAELNLAQTWSATQTFGAAVATTVNGSTVPTSAGTLPGSTGTFTANDCLKVGSTTPLEIADTGSPCGSGSGAVSSVTAGTSGLVSSTPTTGAVVVDMASDPAFTVVGNCTSATAVPTACSMATLQASLISQNAGIVTATVPTGPTNDYNPSGFGTGIAFLYLTPTAGGSTLNGLVSGANAQQVFLINAEAAGGADNIILKNQSTSDTTATNRFMASGDLAIPPGGGVACIYLSGSITRWWCH